MKLTSLFICVVRDQDAPKLAEVLRGENISFTKLASTGGFLKEGNTTFLIATDEETKEKVKDLVRATCSRREEIVESTLPVNEPLGPYLPQKIKVERGGGILLEIPIQYYERF